MDFSSVTAERNALDYRVGDVVETDSLPHPAIPEKFGFFHGVLLAGRR